MEEERKQVYVRCIIVCDDNYCEFFNKIVSMKLRKPHFCVSFYNVTKNL